MRFSSHPSVFRNKIFSELLGIDVKLRNNSWLLLLTPNTKSCASIEAYNWTVESINKGFRKLISDSRQGGRALIEQNHPPGPLRKRGGNQEGMLSKGAAKHSTCSVAFRHHQSTIRGYQRQNPGPCWQREMLSCCGRSHFCPDELCTAKDHEVGVGGGRRETRWRRTFQKGETETASSGRIKESSVEEAEHKIEAEADRESGWELIKNYPKTKFTDEAGSSSGFSMVTSWSSYYASLLLYILNL